ncbi:hypothetical protein QOT17_019043 [Balamuthia mandrillaris]
MPFVHTSKLLFGIVAALLASLLVPVRSEFVLSLDKENLDKIVGGHNYVVVNFVERPWAGVEEWEELGDDFKNVPEVLIARTVTQEQLNNHELLSRYGLSSGSSVLLFPKGSIVPLRYEGEQTRLAIKQWTLSHVSPRFKELLDSVKPFLQKGDEERASMISHAETLMEQLEGIFQEEAKFLITNLGLIAKKGTEFVQKEEARLKGLLDNSALNAQQRTNLERRLELFRGWAKELM